MNKSTLGKVSLVELTSDKIEQVRIWRNSKEVSNYMYTDYEISKTDQEKWYSKIKDDNSCKYFVIVYDGKDAGVLYLTSIDSKNSKCDWGFYLGDSEMRGKGIGGIVEYLTLEYVFTELLLNKLCCEVFQNNDAVIKQHQKFGFTIEGVRRSHIKKNDTFLDVVFMGILATEWNLLREKTYQRILNNLQVKQL